MDRPDIPKPTLQSSRLGGCSTPAQPARKRPLISPPSTEHLSSGDPIAKWVLSLERDILGPTQGILNQADVMNITSSEKHDPLAVQSVFTSARALERNLIRLLDLSKLHAGTLQPAPEICSVQSLTHEARLVARAMAPRLFTGQVQVHLPATDMISMLEKGLLLELLATMTLLVYRASARAQCNLHLSFTGHGPDARATWRIGAERGVLPSLSLDALRSDPLWAPRHLFDLDFVERVASALGCTVAIEGDRSGFVCELSTPPVHEVFSPEVPRNVLWTTVPILMSTASPQGFTPIPGKVVICAPDVDHNDFDIQRQVEESGARLFIAHHTANTAPRTLFNLLIACVGSPVPVLFRSSGLDYDIMSNFQHYVDAFMLEPCRRETLARYVVGLSTRDRRKGRRSAQIHT